MLPQIDFDTDANIGEQCDSSQPLKPIQKIVQAIKRPNLCVDFETNLLCYLA